MDSFAVTLAMEMRRIGAQVYIPKNVQKRVERMEAVEQVQRTNMLQERKRAEKALTGKAFEMNDTIPLFDKYGGEQYYDCVGKEFDASA